MNKRIVILLTLAGILVIVTFTVARANTPFFVSPPPKQTVEAIQTELEATNGVVAAHVTKYPDLEPTVAEPASCPAPVPDILGVVPPRDIQMPFGDHGGITSQANAISSAGYIYMIWAGTPEDNPDQGLIRVMKIFADTCASHKQGIKNTDTTMTDYFAPNGPLFILKIEGATLVYSIASGGSGRFNFVTDQFLSLAPGEQTIETKCPLSAYSAGIFPFRGAVPSFGGSNLVNTAYAISSTGDVYQMWAGAPEGNPNQGLIKVKVLLADPCASSLEGIHAPPTTDYLAPKGPLTFTEIDGDTILYNIAGGDTGRFNYVTDQFMP